MGLQEFRGEQENNVQTVQHERSIKKLYLRTPMNNTVYTSSVFIQVNQTIIVFVIQTPECIIHVICNTILLKCSKQNKKKVEKLDISQ